MPTLDDAINTIRSGNREEGRRILEEILETDEGNEEVWLWLSSVVDTDEDREICLENVLALNPDNVVAQRGLEALRSGTFNINNMMSDVVEEEQPPTTSEATFLDQFTLAGESEGADSEKPQAPGKKSAPAKKAAKTGGFNIRVILLAVLGLCVILALAAAAVFNFMSGEQKVTPTPPGQPAQGTPAQGGQPAPATVTLTLTPVPPTDTPTPTKTPFKLPTPKPTEAPTATGTPVVSPTPRVGK